MFGSAAKPELARDYPKPGCPPASRSLAGQQVRQAVPGSKAGGRRVGLSVNSSRIYPTIINRMPAFARRIHQAHVIFPLELHKCTVFFSRDSGPRPAPIRRAMSGAFGPAGLGLWCWRGVIDRTIPLPSSANWHWFATTTACLRGGMRLAASCECGGFGVELLVFIWYWRFLLAQLAGLLGVGGAWIIVPVRFTALPCTGCCPSIKGC